MSNKRKKLGIFRRYAKNLANLEVKNNWNLPENIYVCPICFQGFGVDYLSPKDQQLKSRTNYLTLEHVPPQKLGGKADILTCYQCNHLNGRIDKEFGRHMKVQSFLRRDTDVNVPLLLNIGDKPYRVTAETTIRGVLWFKFPEDFKIEELQGPLNKVKSFNFQIESAKGIHIHVSLLRAAYLKAFAMFGYDYIMHSSLNIVREQIMNPDRLILPAFSEGLSVDQSEGIYVLTHPNHLKGFIVCFKTKRRNGREEQFSITLPSPAIDVDRFYQTFIEMKNRSETINIRFSGPIHKYDITDIKYTNKIFDL